MKKLLNKSDGQGIVEYVLIVSLIATVMVGSLMQLVQVPIMSCLNTIVAAL